MIVKQPEMRMRPFVSLLGRKRLISRISQSDQIWYDSVVIIIYQLPPSRTISGRLGGNYNLSVSYVLLNKHHFPYPVDNGNPCVSDGSKIVWG